MKKDQAEAIIKELQINIEYFDTMKLNATNAFNHSNNPKWEQGNADGFSTAARRLRQRVEEIKAETENDG